MKAAEKGLRAISKGIIRASAVRFPRCSWSAPTARHIFKCSTPWPREGSLRRKHVQKHVQRHARPFSIAHVDEPTIYALSTAPGRAAIAIIRISGSACLSIYHALCPGKRPPKPRQATVRTLYEPHKLQDPGNILDSDALILYFPSPRTATGEDVLELHVHGGPAVVKAVLAAIPQTLESSPSTSTLQTRRIRYAEPGEFTRRAFQNDRLDLTQVEALSDTLNATTERQRRLSQRGASGHLARRYESWRAQLLSARGELEALIDFSEDQHFDESPAELCANVAVQVEAVARTLGVHVRNAFKGELLRDGIRISLLGAPNAGKSSLLNCIVGREAAIVSREAGTTRDVVEVGIDLGGYFCRLGDTAGLRRAREREAGVGRQEVERGEMELRDVIGEVEKEGMRRARERADESEVVIVVLSFEKQADGSVALLLDPEVLDAARALVRLGRDRVTAIINKTDLAPQPHTLEAARKQVVQGIPGLVKTRIHFTSCALHGLTSHPSFSTRTYDQTRSRDSAGGQVTGAASDPSGIQPFLRNLITQFDQITRAETLPLSPSSESNSPSTEPIDPSIWEESLGTTERQRLLLEECLEHLSAFLAEVENPDSATPSAEDKGLIDDETFQIKLHALAQHEHGKIPPPSNLDPLPHDPDIVIAAEHLRAAAKCLARITGRGVEAGDVEEVLGVVFERFCVGK